MRSRSSPFVVGEHTFAGQHIREYPGALVGSQEDVVRLHAKSYTPREVDDGSIAGQMTIISFHANAFHKECYEPFFEQLYYCLKEKHGVTIGSIWIADEAGQGSSAAMNDGILGNDPHWFDHSRDVIQMVNTFRSHMRRPIVAVGHSKGGTQCVAAAHFHPRLFEAIVLIDPPMTMQWAKNTPLMFKFALSRPETFASRQEAEGWVLKNPLFKGWDPKVIQRYIETAFREGPTTGDPEKQLVVPMTPPSVEARGLARPNPERAHIAGPVTNLQRYTHPDVHTQSPMTGPIYNPHTRQAYGFLKDLRPPCMFLLGQGSQICPPAELEHRLNFTGVGPGGSGGVEAGQVRAVTIPGGHFLPMTNIKGTAEETANWLAERYDWWQKLEARFQNKWSAQSLAVKTRFEPEVEQVLKQWDGKLWHNPLAEPDGGKSRL